MRQPAQATAQRSWWKRHVVDLIVAQFRQGITPEKIALTVALGCVLATFPILGSTTLLCTAAALWLRLNQPIIQLANYLCYPLQILLLIPLYRAGEWLGAPHLALSIPQLMERFRAGPLQFIADFAGIALGGVGIWCLAAPPVGAALYFILRPPLRLLAIRSRRNAGNV
ncbi:DUF2062 domain-containing protein [Nevskia soli]|uniref:DUF2062 domain-containing protein n=1 Tax=Nevskia soli TaxID=418856 RepID=UPI0004A6F5B8|nr:DUF2062 domain-containing protein [Nevskia soli]